MGILSGDERIAKQIDIDGVSDGTVHMKSGVPMKIGLAVLTFIAGILLVLLIWYLMAWYVNEFMDIVLRFPYPSESIGWAWDALIRENKIYGHTILEHLTASLRRVLIAFVGAAVVGIVLGTFLGYFTKIYPIGIIPVTVFQTIPGLAWVPIALLLFGLGDKASTLFHRDADADDDRALRESGVHLKSLAVVEGIVDGNIVLKPEDD